MGSRHVGIVPLGKSIGFESTVQHRNKSNSLIEPHFLANQLSGLYVVANTIGKKSIRLES